MRLLLLVLGLLFSATTTALAHGPGEDPEGFFDGLEHPFFAPGHMLAIAALALRQGQSTFNQVKYTLTVFGLALIAGFLASLSEFFSFYTEIVLLSFAIIICLLTLMEIKKRKFEITVTSILFAIIIGVDSGAGVEGLSSPMATLSGSAITIFLLYACLTFLTFFISRQKPEWMKLGIRVVASWITAIATMVITLFFATF